VTNCTFADNSGRLGNSLAATHYNNWDGNTPPGIIEVSNSILWDGGDEVWEDVNSTVNVTYSAVQMAGRGVYPGIGNIYNNPKFLNLSQGDLRLRPGSPCIDTGDPNFIPSHGRTDAGGAARVLDGNENGSFIVDMGAYEFDPARPIIDVSSDTVEFYGIEGTTSSKNNVFTIRNIGGDVMEWEIEEDCPLLEVAPATGSSTGEFNIVNLSAETSNLTEGQYNCEFTISSPTALNSPRVVPVTFTIVRNCLPESPEYTHQRLAFMEYVSHGQDPGCWCAEPFGTGYQCDGDADGENSGFPAVYRVHLGDLNLIVDNWQKRMGDPALNPCADIDHRDSGFPAGFRVNLGDLNKLVTNWRKQDSQLPRNCPRPDGQ
jgi:hypothetical protein